MKYFVALLVLAVVNSSIQPERAPPDALEKLKENVERIQKEEARDPDRDEYIEANRYDVPSENKKEVQDEDEDKE